MRTNAWDDEDRRIRWTHRCSPSLGGEQEKVSNEKFELFTHGIPSFQEPRGLS